MDDEPEDEAAEADAEGEAEYAFDGFNLELNERIALTPASGD